MICFWRHFDIYIYIYIYRLTPLPPTPSSNAGSSDNAEVRACGTCLLAVLACWACLRCLLVRTHPLTGTHFRLLCMCWCLRMVTSEDIWICVQGWTTHFRLCVSTSMGVLGDPSQTQIRDLGPWLEWDERCSHMQCLVHGFCSYTLRTHPPDRNTF